MQLEDLFSESYAEVSGEDRKQIAITVIIALIGLGIEILAYFQDHCKQPAKEVLRQCKYPTPWGRRRFRIAAHARGYKGDLAIAESVIFNAMKKADLDDVLKELEEKDKWVF